MLDADPDLPMLILGSAEWHKGVVGLVASRLVERYQRPACVISWTSDEGSDANGQAQGTGSLRSVAGVDIGGARDFDGLRTLWNAVTTNHYGLFEGLQPIVTVRENSKSRAAELHNVVSVREREVGADDRIVAAAVERVAQLAAARGDRGAVAARRCRPAGRSPA